METTLLILLFFWLNSILGSVQYSALSDNLNARNIDRSVSEEKLLPESKPLSNLKNPRIVIRKSQRKLELFDGEKLVKTYKVALGSAPVGDKEKEGDRKTPEGDFYIFAKNDESKFYLSLGVSYPNVEVAERGLKAKLISKSEYDKIAQAINNRKMPPQNTRLGGEIYIHGGGSREDWTWGCVALENEAIKELFDAIPVETPVKIEP